MLSRRHTLTIISALLSLLAACGGSRATATATESPTRISLSPTPATAAPMIPTPVVATIWKPPLVASWQWQLASGPLDLSVAASIFDIDGFDRSAAEVAALHAHGRHVICYLSVGSWENWRPDAAQFPASVLGKTLDGYPNERWLDIRQLKLLQPIIDARLDMCRSKGFDAVEPDNVDGYTNASGFPLTASDQLTFNRFIATAAHARGLSVGLKNDLDQVPQLLSAFDWALNEQCFEYQECDPLTAFVAAGKAVFQVEYHLPTSAFCPQANQMNFNSMLKHLSLDAYRVPCR